VGPGPGQAPVRAVGGRHLAVRARGRDGGPGGGAASLEGAAQMLDSQCGLCLILRCLTTRIKGTFTAIAALAGWTFYDCRAQKSRLHCARIAGSGVGKLTTGLARYRRAHSLILGFSRL